MKDILWLIAAFLIILWAIGYYSFGDAIGNLIHVLLALAVLTIIYRIISGKNSK